MADGYQYPTLGQPSHPGFHYFAVGRAAPREQGLNVPLTDRLDVAVEGEPHGQPRYAAG